MKERVYLTLIAFGILCLVISVAVDTSNAKEDRRACIERNQKVIDSMAHDTLMPIHERLIRYRLTKDAIAACEAAR